MGEKVSRALYTLGQCAGAAFMALVMLALAATVFLYLTVMVAGSAKVLRGLQQQEECPQ